MRRQLRPHEQRHRQGDPTATDRADLRQALVGDRDAFARLITRRERNLYGLALVILGHPQDAADALQNGVVLAYRKLRALRQLGSFDSWLRRIVAREALEIARKKGTGPLCLASVAETTVALQAAASQELSESAATRLDLFAALESLDSGQWTAVILRYAADLPVREIARLTGVPGGTIKSRIHYGLKKLRCLMTPASGRRGGGDADA